MTSLELLSPAKDLDCARAAIDCGADAVYMGPPQFGARSAAGNSLDDIAEACRYAHKFGARVYATLNTIVYDSELDRAIDLAVRLDGAGVDAILVQDMALMEELVRRGIAVHASTQTDNRTAERVRRLAYGGCERVVLARELSADEIAAIHRSVPGVELEVFVHGALCVSYSGVCYASEYCFSRSANRGECAQFCRMKFALEDRQGRQLVRPAYLLSLKDMCRLDCLEALAQAGATSFKIEGRLKDTSYVKNITAAYSAALDRLVRQHPDTYRRASLGHSTLGFAPDVNKSFNRHFTLYFADGRRSDIWSPETPKARGEFVGTVKELRRDSFTVAGTAAFASGDGLCFIAADGSTQGFRVNRADCNRLYPFSMPAGLKAGLRLYRNYDIAFERLLARQPAERLIDIDIHVGADAVFSATICGTRLTASVDASGDYETAAKPPHDNVRRQLARMGGTQWVCRHIDVDDEYRLFIPNSRLAEIRRQLAEGLDEAVAGLRATKAPHPAGTASDVQRIKPDSVAPYRYNIANHKAADYYRRHGLADPTPAFELKKSPGAVLMECRHCLRYALGRCKRTTPADSQLPEDLQLVLGDGRRFDLKFDCKKCVMYVMGRD